MKYVRVMDGLKSNAGGFDYKIDEINIATKWNPSSDDPETMGGFNFGTEDKILRWLHRGDTIYDVIVPEDAELIHIDPIKGIYRANKIIVTNPRKITNEMAIELYKKNTLNNKIIAECLQVMLWRDRLEVAEFIINNRVNQENVDEILSEYIRYTSDGNPNYDFSTGLSSTIYRMLSEIKSDLLISQNIDKEPFIKILTNDKVINLTGQSGSGKSTYAQEHFNTSEYLVVDTDEVFSEKRFASTTGINKELGIYFRNKYKTLPDIGNEFDLIYKEILDYCKDKKETIVIDCAQFHCLKDISILKGKIIIIRTSINTCYKRTIERYKINNPNYTEEELTKYKKRKKGIYTWYITTNEFIKQIDSL